MKLSPRRMAKSRKYRVLPILLLTVTLETLIPTVSALGQDAIIEEDPVPDPRDIGGGGHYLRVDPAANPPSRRIGVICTGFQEGGLRGVQLVEVAPNSIADRLGLEPDDVILSVNTHKVRSPNELKIALATASGPIRLRVRNCRDGEIIWLKRTFRFQEEFVEAAQADEVMEESFDRSASGEEL